MNRLAPAICATLVALAACTSTDPVRLGPDGKPLPQVYNISQAERGEIQYRMLDAVNALRQARGTRTLELDPRLNAAAATHSRDMALQNRPWHFGSDGSSPLDRVRRAGFQGQMLGENISETYETELETLSAWMEQPDTRNVVLDAQATHMGFAFHQEPNGKIWWTLVTGRRADMVAGL